MEAWIQFALAGVGLLGALAGAGIGAVIATRVAAAGQAHAERERQRTTLRRLQEDFILGEFHLARLHAEKLFKHETARVQGKNFADLYREMEVEEYLPISTVLNFFRLVDAYRAGGFIDQQEAVEEFGWAYEWWWVNVIDPHRLEPSHPEYKDWEPHLRRIDWLLGPRKSTSR